MSDIRKSIVWADWSWNPVWGCLNKCPYCYARNIAKRFGNQICGRDDFKPVWIEKNFQKPIPKNATHIFVNSMSDVAFWKDEWKVRVFEKIRLHPELKFLFLSKKPIRKMSVHNLKNAYIGNTITNQYDCDYHNEMYAYMLDFISIEPIHEKLDLKGYEHLKQIIVGAETGNRKGKIIPKAEWIEEIREFCQSNGIKLFEKDSLKSIVKRDLIQERI